MQRVIISGALAALAARAAAGVAVSKGDAIKFVDQTWDDVCEGSDWTIKWSKGNGMTTNVKVKGANNWSESIGDAKPCPGEIDWTVKVPECDKEYSIIIQQEECESLESPKFLIACAGEEWEDSADSGSEWEDATSTGNGPAPTGQWADAPAGSNKTWGDAPAPDGKTWGDAPAPDGNTWGDAPAPADAKTWGDAPVAPAQTWADAAAPTPAAGSQWADNGVAPATNTPVAPAAGSSWVNSPVAPLESKPPAVADYTGAASKLSGSFGALAAVVFAALAM